MDSQWLKTQFHMNPRKSKAGLARYLNLEPPAISKILSGARQIKAREYLKMQEFFGIANIAAGDGNFWNKDNNPTNWAIPDDLLHSQKPTQMNIKVCEIPDDTMHPELSKNDNVVIDLSKQVCTPSGVFLLYDGHEYYIRQCRYISEDSQDEIEITAKDKKFETQIIEADAIRIVGRVIGKLEWLEK